MKNDGTTAPLFTLPSLEHGQPLLRHDHGTALAFHMGKHNKAAEQQGFVMDRPWGQDGPASLVPVCCPDATWHLSNVGSSAGQAASGLYLATTTKQAAESADWRQGA